MNKVLTRLVLLFWGVLTVVGGIAVGRWLLTMFATPHTLVAKIGLIFLFIFLIFMGVVFLASIFLAYRDTEHKKQ